MTLYAVAALNVPRGGTFGEHSTDSKPRALFVARHLSKQQAGVPFGVYEWWPSEGALLLASFLNGERTFTAAGEENHPRA